MTAPPAYPDFSQAGKQLDLLCRKVGLEMAQALPTTKDAVQTPPFAALWSGDYAHVLLWPLSGISPASIEKSASEAEGWLDDLLSGYEGKSPGRTIDGYLVLALPQPPGDDAKEEIRRLELSTRICRKHVIWPTVGQNDEHPAEPWCRVADVTVLGLPEAVMAGTSELIWPQIDTEADAVWADLLQLGAPATAQKDDAA
jgi:hypothetical protein